MLDRTRAFGPSSPAWKGASYQQNDEDGTERYYNDQGLEVDIKTGEIIEEAPEPEVAAPDVYDPKPYRQMIDDCKKLPFIQWAVKAAALLGGNPPASKRDLLAELEKRARALENQAANAEKAKKKAGKASTGKGVDLKLWAEGKKKYLFDEVQKAIRAKYSREVAHEADAIDMLIEEGVVNPEKAVRL